jgi:hypothetical protein
MPFRGCSKNVQIKNAAGFAQGQKLRKRLRTDLSTEIVNSHACTLASFQQQMSAHFAGDLRPIRGEGVALLLRGRRNRAN